VTPNLISTKEAAAALGLAVTTLEKLRVYGGGPRYLKLGRSVRYDRNDLLVWAGERRVANTAEADRLTNVSS
jgi:predicted DNA-binding transcriptional regulator AlpA